MEPDFCLSIVVPRSAAEGVVEILEGYGCQALELEKNEADATTRVLAYAATLAELEHWERQLASLGKEQLRHLERRALSPDWSIAWTKWLESVDLTPRLRVHPNALDRPPTAGELFLHPALAFGFGEHPTTRLAANWLEREIVRHPGARVLDFGCGTGILSLAAARCGARRVVGVDNDAGAIAAARENASLNRVGDVCVFTCDSLDMLDRDFDVIVANIDSRVLVHSAQLLATRMSDGATLGVTGFMVEHEAFVTEAFGRIRVPLALLDRSDDWVLLVKEACSPATAKA